MYNKCFFCDKVTYTPYHITEVSGKGKSDSYHLCKSCGIQYLKDSKKDKKEEKSLDLTHLKTTDDLIEFLAGVKILEPARKPCKCGMTEEVFNDVGKFGCPNCYDHFDDKMKELVLPFHNAKEHVGKQPKTQMANDPNEKLKLLKLKYAKALELEEYEKLNGLQEEIDVIRQELLSISEDQ